MLFLEQQLQESRKQADKFIEQRNKLTVEKLELLSAKVNLKEMLRRQMDLVKMTVQQEFPKVFSQLVQLAKKQGGMCTVVDGWAALRAVQQVIHYGMVEEGREEDNEEEAGEEDNEEDNEEVDS